MSSLWSRWNRLAPWERRVFLRLWLSMRLYWLALQGVAAARLIRHASRRSARAGTRALRPADLAADAFARRAAELSTRAADLGPGSPSCLPQSLALAGLLRAAGLDARVELGVVRTGDAFEAHAWVDCAGQTLGEGRVATARIEGLHASGGSRP